MSFGKNQGGPLFTDTPVVDEDGDELPQEALAEASEPCSHEQLWRYLREDTEHSARLLQRQLNQEIAAQRWPGAERTAQRVTDILAHLRAMDALEANVACVVRQYQD